MIAKKELTGTVIKKELGARRCVQRWHNKNKSGGNFGFNIYFSEEFDRATDKEITGEYNRDGDIINLRFGTLWQLGGSVPADAIESKTALFDYIRKYIESEQGVK